VFGHTQLEILSTNSALLRCLGYIALCWLQSSVNIFSHELAVRELSGFLKRQIKYIDLGFGAPNARAQIGYADNFAFAHDHQSGDFVGDDTYSEFLSLKEITCPLK
jgi:hypothetical protein